MTTKNFYSGSGLSQALMAAARDLGLEPDAVAFVLRPKRHGFLRGPRVVIEVDPTAPRRELVAAPKPPEPPEPPNQIPRPATPPAVRDGSRSPSGDPARSSFTSSPGSSPRSSPRRSMDPHDEARIEILAKEAIKTVQESGQPHLTIELNPAERRIVHLVVRDSGLVTESQGEGRLRAVLISAPDPSRIAAD